MTTPDRTEAGPADDTALHPEPVGILGGVAAGEAIAHGLAAPLLGGGLGFALWRDGATLRRAGERAVPEALTARPPAWAGLAAGRCAVMGILNVTPDSFSDGGTRLDTGSALAAGRAMRAQGADIIDIGGESTRPGAAEIGPAEEQDRILPVIEALAAEGALISVDTRHAATMRAAHRLGARIFNDVSGLRHDPESRSTAAELGCPVVIMHMRGTPADMMERAVYRDVVGDVIDELAVAIDEAVAAGVARAAIAVDPGIGFAKLDRHSAVLLRRLPALAALGCPVLVGASRKGLIGRLTGAPAAQKPLERLGGSLAIALHAAAHGASVVRVHDVAETVQALRVWEAISAARC